MCDVEFYAETMTRSAQQICADQAVNSGLLVFYAVLLTLCFNAGSYLNALENDSRTMAQAMATSQGTTTSASIK